MTAHELAQRIAPLLPRGWGVAPPREDCDWADLVREADGACIRVVVGGYRLDGRVTFRGCWPRFADGTGYVGGRSEHITCDVTRAPESIAKDVLRRLLPAYDAAYASAKAYVDKHDANGREAQLVAQRIATALDARVGENRSRRGDGVAVLDEPDCVRRLVVQPAYDGATHTRPVSVDFEVHGLDPETAAAVLALIREAERRRVAENVRVNALEPETDDEEELELRVRQA